MNDTRTIQVWPSGDGYEYRGDPADDSAAVPGSAPRFLRKHKGGERDRPWRKGAADEWAAILAEVRVERYIEAEILKCDSMLVSSHLEAGSDCPAALREEWDWDHVTGLYPDPSKWDASKCKNYLDGVNAVLCEDTHSTEALRQEVRDNAEMDEIYEWWAVTAWLAGELAAIGEPVLGNSYGYWWGRTCPGQAMKMDGALRRVARRQEASR